MKTRISSIIGSRQPPSTNYLNCASVPGPPNGILKEVLQRCVRYLGFFSWVQSRAIVTSWFGVGSALAEFCSEEEGNLPLLQAMYKNWPFFRNTIQNLEMDVAKADMGIARQYARLVADENLAERQFAWIEAEHRLTSDYVCLITGHPKTTGFAAGHSAFHQPAQSLYRPHQFHPSRIASAVSQQRRGGSATARIAASRFGYRQRHRRGHEDHGMTRQPLSPSEIQQRLLKLHGWVHRDDALVKEFRFSNYPDAVAFANQVASISEDEDHHPELTITWRAVRVLYTTHDAGNRVTRRDFALAHRVDALG